jgi:hypothetical protein
MQKYKKGLFNCIKPVLEVYGIDVKELESQLISNCQEHVKADPIQEYVFST